MTEKKRDPASYGNHSREHMLKMNRARWDKFYEETRPVPIETPVLNWTPPKDVS